MIDQKMFKDEFYKQLDILTQLVKAGGVPQWPDTGICCNLEHMIEASAKVIFPFPSPVYYVIARFGYDYQPDGKHACHEQKENAYPIPWDRDGHEWSGENLQKRLDFIQFMVNNSHKFDEFYEEFLIKYNHK